MNAVNWFEIPAADFNRACRYYETVLGSKLRSSENALPGTRLAVLDYAEPGVGGAIIAANHAKPSATGTLVYLHTPDLDSVLGRVKEAGGEVLMPKTFLNADIGHIAVMRDSEGNSVGLHMPS